MGPREDATGGRGGGGAARQSVLREELGEGERSEPEAETAKDLATVGHRWVGLGRAVHRRVP